MDKLTKFLVATMLVALMPMKSIAQSTQIADNEPTISFDITNIANFDERVFFLYNLTTDGRFEVINSERDGIFIVSASESFDGINLTETFADFREQNASDFSSMSKEQAAEVAAEYKGVLPNEFTSSLMMDYYIRSRQNNTCANADPFCTDNGMYEFPAGTNAGSGEPGPYYSCLSTTPNPAWYYMRILNPGNIDIYMYSTPSKDIDFCCWGPFTDPTSPCPNGLTSNKVVSCSYSTASTEHCLIPASAQTGDYFILVITNYSNAACNISFSKVAGTGTTDCGILPPLVNNEGPYCVGDVIHLTANGQAGASYSWTGPNGFSSVQQNPTINNCTMAMAGIYTCTISLGSATNSAETEVVIYPQPTANFNFTTVCQGEATQFTSTSTTNPTGQQISDYQWNFGDGQTSNHQNPSHQYANAGSYQVTLTVSCGNGLCTSSKTQTVTVNAQPAANAGPDQTIAYGSTAQLSGSGGAGTFNFHWEPANMVTNPNSQNTQTVTLTQDQTYTLTVTNPQGQCTSSDEVTIHINGSAMTVNATASPSSICQGGSTQLAANAGGGTGNFTYSWTPTTGLSNPNIYNPIASPSETTTYTCHVSDGQTSQNVSVTVTVNDVIVENEYMTICPGDVYHWHGASYDNAGTYQIDTVTDQGCDKTIYLHLDHYPIYDETTIEEAICFGETYNFFGTTFDYSTTGYPHTLQTIHGCDSIVRLNLTVWPENEIDLKEVSLCPEQLPYTFYGVSYYDDVDVTETDTDIHGCDSIVRLVLTVSDYYMPEVKTEYICYTDTPSYDWNPIGDYHITLHEDGFYTDTLPTSDCEGIFRLNLNFQQIPETIVEEVITCDSYTWPMTGETFTQSDDYYHPVSLYPFPCEQMYQLHLTINTQSILEDKYISGDCDETPVFWFGQDTTFTMNTVYTFTGTTDEGCYREQTYHIDNMRYTPYPEIIKPNETSTVVFGLPEDPNVPDTALCAAVVTNTEFFSFQYDFFVEETGSSIWDTCVWSISKPSWQITPTFGSDHKSSFCKVFVADRDDNYVVLTATAKNSCGEFTRKFYLKSSFLDVDENELAAADVNIVPNPNNGQMHLDFENMEGRTAVKVFDMTGNQIDAFETTITSNRHNYDYSLKKYADGIYFFVISNNNRVLTKKVIVIQ